MSSVLLMLAKISQPVHDLRVGCAWTKASLKMKKEEEKKEKKKRVGIIYNTLGSYFISLQCIILSAKV